MADYTTRLTKRVRSSGDVEIRAQSQVFVQDAEHGSRVTLSDIMGPRNGTILEYKEYRNLANVNVAQNEILDDPQPTFTIASEKHQIHIHGVITVNETGADKRYISPTIQRSVNGAAFADWYGPSASALGTIEAGDHVVSIAYDVLDAPGVGTVSYRIIMRLPDANNVDLEPFEDGTVLRFDKIYLDPSIGTVSTTQW